MRQMYKEKETSKRVTEEAEDTAPAPQDTPAADSTEGKLAEIDEVLAETLTHEAAEAAMTEIQRKIMAFELTETQAEEEVEAWSQKYAVLGLAAIWCCGLPQAIRSSG